MGKSCLTVRFLKDEFTNDYDPTIGTSYHPVQPLSSILPYPHTHPPITTHTEENYRKHITVDTNPCTVNIIDTAGQHEYTALRDQHLKDGKGFLLVFALNDKTTFEEVKQLREQIVKLKDTKRVPLVVCGNKCVGVFDCRVGGGVRGLNGWIDGSDGVGVFCGWMERNDG